MRKFVLIATAVGLSAGAVKADLTGFGGFATPNTNNSADAYGSGNTTFTLTSGNTAGGETTSGFATTAQNIGAFNASFTYQATNLGGCCGGGADGVALVLQNSTSGTGAIGGGGGSLGLTGITPSAALELNIFPNATGGPGETFRTDGNTPAQSGSYNSTSPVNLRSGDPINVALAYDGTTLTETLTDPTASTSYTKSYTVDLPTVLGANTALVGFTGADGGATSQQVVSNFSFTSVPEPTSLGLLALGGLTLAARRRRA